MWYGEPTEIYKQLEARQRLAEADPLEVGMKLEWSGPNLGKDALPPADYPHDRSASPNPLRKLHSILLDDRDGPSAHRWTLSLVEPLKLGTGEYSQVWRVEASSDKEPTIRIPLVVKLFQQSLFPFPQDESRRTPYEWHLPPKLIAGEMQGYHLARDAQGSDLPLCYGFFTFRLPSEEEAVGVVLEDLLENRQGVPFDKFFEREAKKDRLTLDVIDRGMCAALRLQNRVHELGLAWVVTGLDQIVALNFPDPRLEEPRLVAFGFSLSKIKAELVAAFEAGTTNIPAWIWRWNTTDQGALFCHIADLFASWSRKHDEIAQEWQKLEKARKALGFLRMHEKLDRPKETPKRVSREQKMQDKKERAEVHRLLEEADPYRLR